MISSARPLYMACSRSRMLASPTPPSRLRREAHAVIAHVHGKLAIDDLRADLQRAAFRLRLETVLDRVLDQRLQHHRREHRRFQAFGDVDDRSQALLHSNGHDFQERARQVQLLTERGPAAFAHLRHRRAQVADQALLHLRRALRVGLDQLVDARQRVEQEMRLDLRLQCFHPRFQHGALELLGFRAFGRFAGGKFGPALAARDDLDDERRDDQHQDRHRMLAECRRAPAPAGTRAAASSTTRWRANRRSATRSRRLCRGSRAAFAEFRNAARRCPAGLCRRLLLNCLGSFRSHYPPNTSCAETTRERPGAPARRDAPHEGGSGMPKTPPVRKPAEAGRRRFAVERAARGRLVGRPVGITGRARASPGRIADCRDAPGTRVRTNHVGSACAADATRPTELARCSSPRCMPAC